MRWFGVFVVLAIATAAPARGDDATAPWSQGVSAERKAAAKRLLEAGNVQFLEHHYADALESYKHAVEKWDHPAIRFNIVRCLIQLDRPAEASENLAAALQYGATPLEDAVYAEAIAYQKLLANQTGELEVGCSQAGAIVTLDGQPVGPCPGKQVRRVAVGRHQIVGAMQGFLTKTIDVVVTGGAHEHTDMALLPLSETARVVHRWPAWIPWVVFGGGLAVVGAGALVEGIAASKISEFDRALVRDCSGPGCGSNRPIPDADLQIESSAHVYGAIGAGVLVTGAAATAIGGVMLYMNRGRTVHGYEQLPVEVTNVRGGAMLTLRGAF